MKSKKQTSSSLLDEYIISNDLKFIPDENEKNINQNENLLYKDLEKDNANNLSKTALSLKWYSIYTYLLIPIRCFSFFVATIGGIDNFDSYIYDKSNLLLFLITLVLGIFYLIMFFQMKHFKKNTYEMILTSFIVETFFIIGNGISRNLANSSILIAFLIWIIPNYMYFKKRKKLFIN